MKLNKFRYPNQLTLYKITQPKLFKYDLSLGWLMICLDYIRFWKII